MSISRRKICCDGLGSLSITSSVGLAIRGGGYSRCCAHQGNEHLDVVGHHGLQPRITYQKERAVLIFKLFVPESLEFKASPKIHPRKAAFFFADESKPMTHSKIYQQIS